MMSDPHLRKYLEGKVYGVDTGGWGSEGARRAMQEKAQAERYRKEIFCQLPEPKPKAAPSYVVGRVAFAPAPAVPAVTPASPASRGSGASPLALFDLPRALVEGFCEFIFAESGTYFTAAVIMSAIIGGVFGYLLAWDPSGGLLNWIIGGGAIALCAVAGALVPPIAFVAGSIALWLIGAALVAAAIVAAIAATCAGIAYLAVLAWMLLKAAVLALIA